MTTQSFTVSDGTAGRWKITVYCDLVSTDNTNNRSTWKYRGYLEDGPFGAGPSGTIRNTWYVRVKSSGTQIANQTGGAFAYYPDNGTVYLFNEATVLANHSSVGTLELTVECFAEGDIGPSSTVYSAGGTMTVTGEADINRSPLAPAAPAITRTGTGTSVTVASAVAAAAAGSPDPPAITDYKYRYSTDNSSWTEVTGMGTDRVDTFGPTVPITVSGTQVYYFQTAATNSEGYSAWSASGVGYAAPTITSLTRAGLSATVAVSPNASNGGSTITSHVVQASSDQTTWTSQTISGAAGGSTTFASLSPGRTWYFRAFATNAAGVNSPVTATQSIFISAYGKRYDSTLSDFATINTGKRYDASGAWVDIQTTKKYADASIVAPGVSGSGSVVTYNATAHPYSVGDVVSITGVSPTAYNLTNVTITSIATNSFTVNSTATGTYVSGGTIVGWATFK